MDEYELDFLKAYRDMEFAERVLLNLFEFIEPLGVLSASRRVVMLQDLTPARLKALGELPKRLLDFGDARKRALDRWRCLTLDQRVGFVDPRSGDFLSAETAADAVAE